MKKLPKTPKYKKYHAKRSKDRFVRDYNFRQRRKGARVATSEKPSAKKAQKINFSSPFSSTRVEAPHEFSFLNNTEEVCAFVGKLQRLMLRRAPVYVDLERIRGIDLGAVAILLSVMVRFRRSGIGFNGNMPRDAGAHSMLKQSRFFDYLLAPGTIGSGDEGAFSAKARIVTHAKTIVDSDLTASVLRTAAHNVWGEPRRCTGVQRALIELMHNTYDHASGRQKGEKHWWLSMRAVDSDKRVVISFVDYGIGVFESLQSKSATEKYFGWLMQFRMRNPGSSNADALEEIFHGARRTVTKEKHRGRGLPSIYQCLKARDFTELIMVTNDVKYDSRSDTYEHLSKPFSGTFVSFSIDPDCGSLPPCKLAS